MHKPHALNMCNVCYITAGNAVMDASHVSCGTNVKALSYVHIASAYLHSLQEEQEASLDDWQPPATQAASFRHRLLYVFCQCFRPGAWTNSWS